MPCNGNCNQGRACDCVPDVEIDDDFGLIRGLVSAAAIYAIVAIATLLGLEMHDA